MFEILTSKNQFNFSIKQLIIDYTNKKYLINYGGQCRIAKKNSTTKAINQKIEQLREAGFECLQGVSA